MKFNGGWSISDVKTILRAVHLWEIYRHANREQRRAIRQAAVGSILVWRKQQVSPEFKRAWRM
jgi:hypothetical protein